MRTGDIIIRLNQLIQIDIDAVNAYSQAILALPPGPVRDRLATFRGDHERHVRDLSALVLDLGGTPRRSRDLMGFMVEGFTAASGMLGEAGALTAMRSNEELTFLAYERALALDLPPDAAALVRANRDDEERHRAYIAARLRGE